MVDQLRDHGIAARIFNANASSLAGELPIEASLPQVWVDDASRAEHARGVITAYLAKRHSGTPWRCNKCGEENPGSFESCWACGENLAG